MVQDIICILLVILACIYLYHKLIPRRRKKNLPFAVPSHKPPNCGCGHSCPLGKQK